MTSSWPFRDVVVVADLRDDADHASHHLRRDLEGTDRDTLAELFATIDRLGLRVHHYETPAELATRATLHTGDVVLSIFGGAVSRSRMALVPAVCESFGLTYVGPDAYGRVICQNKEVSKALASEAGLSTPRHRLIRRKEDIVHIDEFPLPYVIKPLWEGSSIGIGADSLTVDRLRGAGVIADRLNEFRQPVMVEEFVPGREVSWCFVDAGETRWRSLAELQWPGDPTHFEHNLYDAVHKLSGEITPIVKLVPEGLGESDINALEQILEVAGPLSYGRIDGKLVDGKFVFLEITPDAWLGATGTFIQSFVLAGFTFDQVIEHVLLSAIQAPQRQ